MKIIKGKLPITKPGIYRDIDIEDYHSAAIVPEGEFSVSSSNLRDAWLLSLAHAYDGWAHNPDREAWKGTRPMIVGKAAHHLFLGEDRFNTRFVQQPLEYRDLKTAELKPWNNNANVCKEWHEKQAKSGRTVLTQIELEKIRRMARSLSLEPVFVEMLTGATECSMIAKDKETGLWLKARPDVIPTTSGDFVDLKLTEDITDVGIRNTIRRYGYHMQGGMVWMLAEMLNVNFETFTLAFIESDRPHCARLVPIEDEDLARGRQQCVAMMRRIAECIVKGHWPGPGEGELRSIWLPNSEREAIDARLKEEGVL